MTASVPMARERGRLRPGSRISSATYADAFHPENASMTGMNANSQLPADTRGRRRRSRSRTGAKGEAGKNEQQECRYLERREDVAWSHGRDRRRGCGWIASSHTEATPTMVCIEKGQWHVGNRNHERAAPSCRRRARRSGQVDRNEERVGRDRAGETGDEQRPPVRNAAARP